MEKSKKITIFFAIPCGEFFNIQKKIIQNVCNAFKIKPIIVEDDRVTDFLWKKITKEIDNSDYFVADISSKSLNIFLELGYVLREKKHRFIAIFVSSSIEPLVDLQGLVLNKYISFKDLRKKLIGWIKDNVLLGTKIRPDAYKFSKLREDFSDIDRFIRLWSAPGGSVSFTHEGITVTNAHFPIMTNYLAPLNNYEFEFETRIVNKAVGWAVKGTKRFISIVPEFCIMFNIQTDNILTPHIFNINKYMPAGGGYKVFSEKAKKVNIKKSKNGWFKIKTIVKENVITIVNDNKIIFSDDFSKEPYKEYYNFPNKQGEIGFRCHQNGEEAIIRYFDIQEL